MDTQLEGVLTVKIISVVCQKGGAGKTTIATNLAVLAERGGFPTVLLDLDPQATAAKWGDKREGRPPDVVAAQAPRLGRILEDAKRQGAGVAIIDTAPTADTAALEAVKVADLVLVPCQPSDFDLGAVGATVRLAEQLAGKPSWVIMNAVPPTSKITEEAITVLTGAGVRVAPVRLVRRLDFVNGLPVGQSAIEWDERGKAAGETVALWEWASQLVGLPASQQAA
jgi:chromosome partitioning protein